MPKYSTRFASGSFCTVGISVEWRRVDPETIWFSTPKFGSHLKTRSDQVKGPISKIVHRSYKYLKDKNG